MKTQSFIKKFQSFEQWFVNLKSECEQIQSKDEAVFLKTKLPEVKDFFYRKIEEFAKDCHLLTKEEQQKIKTVIANSQFVKISKSAPFFKWSIEQPRGYPGDAETMSIIYRNQFEGANTFGKIMNKIGTESAAGIAIRNRKKLITDEVKNMKKGQVLSLAAGPALELFDFLESSPQSRHHFTALDHDIQTLKDANEKNKFQNLKYSISNAFHLIRGQRKTLTPRELMLNFCNPKKDLKGWRKLFVPIKYRVETLSHNQFDFIYSIGLFDYIQTFENPKKGTKALTSELFKMLKPGGLLMIGNVSPQMPPGIVWSMEYLCNWKLIYRDESEVRAFRDGIKNREIRDIEIVMEPAGINYFIKIKKQKKIHLPSIQKR